MTKGHDYISPLIRAADYILEHGRDEMGETTLYKFYSDPNNEEILKKIDSKEDLFQKSVAIILALRKGIRNDYIEKRYSNTPYRIDFVKHPQTRIDLFMARFAYLLSKGRYEDIQKRMTSVPINEILGSIELANKLVEILKNLNISSDIIKKKFPQIYAGLYKIAARNISFVIVNKSRYKFKFIKDINYDNARSIINYLQLSPEERLRIVYSKKEYPFSLDVPINKVFLSSITGNVDIIIKIIEESSRPKLEKALDVLYFIHKGAKIFSRSGMLNLFYYLDKLLEDDDVRSSISKIYTRLGYKISDAARDTIFNDPFNVNLDKLRNIQSTFSDIEKPLKTLDLIYKGLEASEDLKDHVPKSVSTILELRKLLKDLQDNPYELEKKIDKIEKSKNIEDTLRRFLDSIKVIYYFHRFRHEDAAKIAKKLDIIFPFIETHLSALLDITYYSIAGSKAYDKLTGYASKSKIEVFKGIYYVITGLTNYYDAEGDPKKIEMAYEELKNGVKLIIENIGDLECKIENAEYGVTYNGCFSLYAPRLLPIALHLAIIGAIYGSKAFSELENKDKSEKFPARELQIEAVKLMIKYKNKLKFLPHYLIYKDEPDRKYINIIKDALKGAVNHAVMSGRFKLAQEIIEFMENDLEALFKEPEDVKIYNKDDDNVIMMYYKGLSKIRTGEVFDGIYYLEKAIGGIKSDKIKQSILNELAIRYFLLGLMDYSREYTKLLKNGKK